MPPLERGGARVEVQQVVQGIGLPLEPEGVLPPYPGHHLQRGRLAGVGDHAVIVRGRHRPHAGAEAAGEEVVPAGEALVFLSRHGVEDPLEALWGGVVAGPERPLRHLDHLLLRHVTQPGDDQGLAIQGAHRLRQHITGRGTLQEVGPVTEDLAQLLVHQRIGKEVVPGGRRHGPVEQGIDGESDQPGGLLGLHILIGFRGRGHDAVEQLQELIEAAHLDLTERRAVLVLPRLVKHPLCLLMQERILLHQRLQSGDRGHQRARLAGDRLTQPLYPARHMGLIPGDPATGMGMGGTRIHCLVHRSLLVEAPWARRMRCA